MQAKNHPPRATRHQPDLPAGGISLLLASGIVHRPATPLSMQPNAQPTASCKGSSKKQDADDRYTNLYWLATFLPALTYLILSRTVLSHHHPRHGKRGGGLFGLSGTYEVISAEIAIGGGGKSPDVITPGEIFYLPKNYHENLIEDDGTMRAKLVHPLEAVLGTPYVHSAASSSTKASTSAGDNVLGNVHSLSYLHEPELGRGYLLISDSANSGRIWRWEVGGGPITIGRSLHMERSGCRSGLWTSEGGGNDSSNKKPTTYVVDGKPTGTSCPPNILGYNKNDYGSAGLTVEISRDAESSRTGKLVLAERGERRIIRIEEDGARTPLVLNVPSPCEGAEDDDKTVRISGDGRVLYGPFGDLIFTDTTACLGGDYSSAVYILREAVNLAPVPASKSREAHSWKEMPQREEIPELLYNGMEVIADIVLGPGGEELFVVGLVGDSVRVVKIPLDQDEDEDEDDTEEKTPSAERDDNTTVVPGGKLDDRAKLFFDLTTKYEDGATASTALAADNDGHIYATYPGGLMVIDKDGNEVANLALNAAESAKMPLTEVVPSAAEIGEDGYLYVSTSTSLLRVRVRVGPTKIGTDMVVPPKKEPRSNIA